MWYVTKYGLTEGIWEVPEDEATLSDDKKYLYVGEMGHMPIQVLTRDFHTTLEAAQKRIQQQVEAKLRSIEKATAKLKSYNPKVKPWTSR